MSVRLLLTQSDARLVELARAGHERAFEALVERYRRALLGYCRRQLLSHERAEDALQQGLLQAWLALREGAEVRHVRPWLYSIVHNTALNMRRSGYSYVQLSETLCGAGAPAEDLDRRIAVREALAGLAALPEMQREALLRTAVDGSSYQEAAVMLGLSEGAVRGLVHRARTTLRTAFTALTPPPLLSWMLGSGGADAPLAGRIAEVGAGGGSAGLTAGLLKLAATAATAGVVAGGVGISHRHHGATARRRPRATAIAPTRDGPTGADAGAAHLLALDDARGGGHAIGKAPARGNGARDRPDRTALHRGGGGRLHPHSHHRRLVVAEAPQSPLRAAPGPPVPSGRSDAIAMQPSGERGASSNAGGGQHPARGGDRDGRASEQRWSGASEGSGNEPASSPNAPEGRQGSDDAHSSGASETGGQESSGGDGAQGQSQDGDASSEHQQKQSGGASDDRGRREGSNDGAGKDGSSGDAETVPSGSNPTGTGSEGGDGEREKSPTGGD